MACSPKVGGLSVYVSHKNDIFSPKTNWVSISNGFWGKSILGSDQKDSKNWNLVSSPRFTIRGERSILVRRSMRWWEKTLKPNMIEIESAQEFVDQLVNAGERLVIVDFYSPGCGGCRALHPKICQLAEMNPNAVFLKVNYEELKKMCHALHIHVLPFFRFYKGAEGRLCSFSCTNATIKKFKDALAEHGTERASNGLAKGLNESELLALAAIGEITLNSSLSSDTNSQDEKSENPISNTVGVSDDWSVANNGLVGAKEEKSSVLA